MLSSVEQMRLKIQTKLGSGFDILVYEKLDSTNTFLKTLVEQGKNDNTIIIAYEQSGGRGTQGRKFFSPRNGLYMSMLLPNAGIVKSSMITVVTAVAVVDAIRDVLRVDCGIKWVNDIIYQGKKVGGILTEGEYDTGNGKLKYAIVGVGLNLQLPNTGFDKEIQDVAGALLDEIDDETYSNLVAQIIKNSYAMYSMLEDKKYIKKYQEYSVLNKKTINYIQNGQKKCGIVAGVDEEARLIVYQNGEEIRLCAGEVSILK